MFNTKFKAEIKSFDCIDHDPIESWTPSDPFDIDIFMTFTIGIYKINGGDNFQAHFLTNNNVSKYGKYDKHFIITKYSLDEIIKIINEIILKSTKNNWNETAKELNRYLDWEFDNYQEYEGK